MKLCAHTAGVSETDWEDLSKHLNGVADRAAEDATKFDATEFGRAAGLLHDIGKAKPSWQLYLRGKSVSVPHAGEGARYAVRHYSRKCPPPFHAPIGRLLAYAIAAHHAGLPNGAETGSGLTPLDQRLAAVAADEVAPWFDLPVFERAPLPLRTAPKDPFAWAFFIRMLFSALVDADRLATEVFDQTFKGEPSLRGVETTLGNLKRTLDAHLKSAFSSAKSDAAIALLRAEVQADCRRAATNEPGLFSLTVPTGGGKTLSSLAFALDHTAHHTGRFDRVIYVIPFTSIIDQTADVFRKALADADAVLEHHSAFDDEKFEQALGNEQDKRNFTIEKLRLAAQNWDRPVVVTTAVQFLESLFANSPKRCRKLHNIARSVIVLDEAQTLPIKFLRPCLAALKELARGYGCSVVFCTATQPALTKEAFKKAAPASIPPTEMLDDANMREIIRPGRDLYKRLDRVRSEVAATMTDDQLVEALGATDQGLVIVDNRRHARDLFKSLKQAGAEGARHLTTAMTAAHRQHVLKKVRTEIETLRPVRLVSTSLIEAGVDVSFKAVWRARAGLDQIVQAAGRCNRNGELGRQGGRLTIFTPEAKEGRGTPHELQQNADAGGRVLDRGAKAPPEGKGFDGWLRWKRRAAPPLSITNAAILGRCGNHRGFRQGRVDVLAAIKVKIVAAIEADVGTFEMPWHQPGTSLDIPTNALTQKRHRDINILSLCIDADAAQFEHLFAPKHNNSKVLWCIKATTHIAYDLPRSIRLLLSA